MWYVIVFIAGFLLGTKFGPKADATRGNMNGPAGITSQAAGAGREHGTGVPRVSQAEAGQNPAGNAPTDGTADNWSGIAGQSDGLQGGGAGMPIG